MRQKIDEGWESLGRGEGVDGEAFFADLERKERALAKPQRKRDRKARSPCLTHQSGIPRFAFQF